MDFPDDVKTDLSVESNQNQVRFTVNGKATSWMDLDDSFVERIRFGNLNRNFLDEHLFKEIEIKNTLDEGIVHLNHERYQKAVKCFNEAIYYDECYAAALINKSYALRGQGHFVKSLRHYKKAVKCDDGLKDIEFHKSLIRQANGERDNFPKIKSDIYAGDEHFTRKEYEKAIESYDKALASPSGFKEKILSKLLNKKATALVKLERYGEALDCFRKSLTAGANDYAYFGQGFCEHELDLKLSDEFLRPLKITKRQSLIQAEILNEMGFFAESLKICDYLFENHFRNDDFYCELIDVRQYAMSHLDL